MIPASDDLIFRGRNGLECEDFVYGIQKLARAFNKGNDGEWMATKALSRMTGSALLFCETGLDGTERSDWFRLRIKLLEHWPTSPAQVQAPSLITPVAPNTPASVSVAAPTFSTAPVALQPSERLNPYRQSDTPVFNLKVIAPKVGYAGFVSRVFDDSEFGVRCCMLTEDKSTAFECLQPHEERRYRSSGALSWWETESRIRQANRTENANIHLPTLRLFRTRDDWLSSILSLAAPITDNKDSEQATIREDRLPAENPLDSLRGSWGWNELTGRLTPPSGRLIMLGKNPQGALTLYFWDRRVWDDEDDIYAAELYLVRAN